jgi:hypothetical protein
MVELLLLAFGQARFGMEFPSFLMKWLYRHDLVFIALLVRTVYHEKVSMTVG